MMTSLRSQPIAILRHGRVGETYGPEIRYRVRVTNDNVEYWYMIHDTVLVMIVVLQKLENQTSF